MSITVADPEFARAIELMDNGRVGELEALLRQCPRLARETVPLAESRAGQYFDNPRLLWFAAENPVRNETLPRNIVEVVRVVVEAAKCENAGTLEADLNYTLTLVASGRVARETGQQVPLIECLTGLGADANAAMIPALAHRELAAARCLLRCGADPTLQARSGLGMHEDVVSIASGAPKSDLQEALALAAYNRHAGVAGLLLDCGAEPNVYNPDGLHAHATPLHLAVDAGCLETVKTLIERGADPAMPDKLFGGTAVGWAEHFQRGDILAYLEHVA